jgi:hypothetical protein
LDFVEGKAEVSLAGKYGNSSPITGGKEGGQFLIIGYRKLATGEASVFGQPFIGGKFPLGNAIPQVILLRGQTPSPRTFVPKTSKTGQVGLHLLDVARWCVLPKVGSQRHIVGGIEERREEHEGCQMSNVKW